MSAQAIFKTMFSPDAGQTTTERSFAPRGGWRSSAHQFSFTHAGDVMLNPGPQTSLAQAQVQKSLVDQLGVPVQVNQPPPPQIAQPKPAQPQAPQPGAAPSPGVSTTTMLVLGGVAFVAVMMLLRGRKS